MGPASFIAVESDRPKPETGDRLLEMADGASTPARADGSGKKPADRTKAQKATSHPLSGAVKALLGPVFHRLPVPARRRLRRVRRRLRRALRTSRAISADRSNRADRGEGKSSDPGARARDLPSRASATDARRGAGDRPKSDKGPTNVHAVYSMRRDGLGSRLTGLVTAMRVAELIGADFKFTWTGLSTWALNFGPVRGHSIAAPTELFTQRFLDQHLIARRDADLDLPQLKGDGDMTLRDLRERFDRDGAIRIGYVPLKKSFSPDFPASTFAMRDCFDRIEFSPAIRGAIESAQNLDIAGPMTALHVRGGDIVYGEWRKRVHWTYKGMTIPIAKAMVAWALEKGSSIVCFGSDGAILDYLSEELGITNGSALAAQFATEAERSMFEIVLMSRAVEVIAGTSTFASVAASFDGIPIHQPEQVMSWTDREQACICDLEANADAYDRFQTAFAYWYLYYDGRQQRPSRANIEWLDKAKEYDPENQMYPLVKAALLYKIEADDEAEKVVEQAFESDIQHGDSQVSKVLSGGVRANYLREYQPYFRQAWLRGRPFASVLHAVTQRARGNHELCTEILTDPNVTSLGPQILELIPPPATDPE